MSISSAKFIKSVVGDDEVLENGFPQIAFIGRSNVGKSSVINALVHQKNLVKTSSFPGCTQHINIFLINNKFHFIDLPGYGFAQVSKGEKKRFQILTDWYLFDSNYRQKKVVLIIDAKVGVMESDLAIFEKLKQDAKSVIIVANKVDKIKKSEYDAQMKKIHEAFGKRRFIQYSAEKGIGIGALTNEIFK